MMQRSVHPARTVEETDEASKREVEPNTAGWTDGTCREAAELCDCFVCEEATGHGHETRRSASGGETTALGIQDELNSQQITLTIYIRKS